MLHICTYDESPCCLMNNITNVFTEHRELLILIKLKQLNAIMNKYIIHIYRGRRYSTIHYFSQNLSVYTIFKVRFCATLMICINYFTLNI